MISKKDNVERFNSVWNSDYFLELLLKFKTSHILSEQVFRDYVISCLSTFSFTVFQGAKSSFLEESFLIEKPSRSVLNWVIYIGIIGIVLYLTFSLFRSIQSKVFFYSFLSSVKSRVCPSLGRLWTCCVTHSQAENSYVCVTRVSEETKLRVWHCHVCYIV